MSTAWIVLLLVALVALAGGALWWLRARRRQRRRLKRAVRRTTPQHPVVLMHGVLGFDEIAVGRERHAYFRDVDDVAKKAGVTLHRPRVPPLSSVPQRAEALVRFLDELDVPRVNLIAHSMGGLDARYALCRLGAADRVASLITIGTPHRGTPLADVGTRLGDLVGGRRLLRAIGLDVDAFWDLTCARLEPFNGEIVDQEQVFYGSVVGAADTAARMTPLLVPTHRLLHQRSGPNDGLVPATSQEWGELLLEVEADHWAQIGWSKHFDAGAMFGQLFAELRAREL